MILNDQGIWLKLVAEILNILYERVFYIVHFDLSIKNYQVNESVNSWTPNKVTTFNFIYSHFKENLSETKEKS